MTSTDPLSAAIEQIRILLVEDDPGDVLITREALEKSKLLHHLDVVTNGEEAVAYLRHEGAYADSFHPHLVLLDLNLPRMDGREVLATVKSDPSLSHIPVIVLTTSEAETDVVATYRLHANAFITKPVDFERFHAVVRGIDDFFLTLVRLPSSAVRYGSPAPRAAGRPTTGGAPDVAAP